MCVCVCVCVCVYYSIILPYALQFTGVWICCFYFVILFSVRQLMTLAEKDEFGEVEVSTVFEPSMSAFAGLFVEREKMKVCIFWVLNI